MYSFCRGSPFKEWSKHCNVTKSKVPCDNQGKFFMWLKTKVFFYFAADVGSADFSPQPVQSPLLSGELRFVVVLENFLKKIIYFTCETIYIVRMYTG